MENLSEENQSKLKNILSWNNRCTNTRANSSKTNVRWKSCILYPSFNDMVVSPYTLWNFVHVNFLFLKCASLFVFFHSLPHWATSSTHKYPICISLGKRRTHKNQTETPGKMLTNLHAVFIWENTCRYFD